MGSRAKLETTRENIEFAASKNVSHAVEKEGLRSTDEPLMRLVDFKILVSAEA